MFNPVSKPVIHIIYGFLNAHGGSEQEALYLGRLLGERSDVRFWSSSSRVSPELASQYGIRKIGPGAGNRPDGGVYVFVGAHWRRRLWPYLSAAPARLIYVFNTFHPRILSLTSAHPPMLRWPKTEYVFISEFQKQLLGVPGEVQPSPIDIRLFAPAPGPRTSSAPLVIGRLSRDTADKHDPEDIALYRRWAEEGAQVRLQGATCLRDALDAATAAGPNVQLLAEGTMPAADFLRSLDVFYYRTGAHVETFGRVVLEAMACALPVVCHRRGGYAEWIRHGENGFLFDSTDEAREIVASLMADPSLRVSIGARARETVESMYSSEAVERRTRFYLSGPRVQVPGASDH
jgi:glycosyltransferase involved in cell wall biosynthesis